MISTPEDLLFRNSKSKLFENQSELVEFLITQEQSKYNKTDKLTVKSAISQIVNGNRKLSPKLEISIKESLRESSFDIKKVEYVLSNIVTVIDDYYYFKRNMAKDSILFEEEDFLLMTEKISIAKTVDVITAHPITRRNNTSSKILIDTLFDKVGIFESHSGLIEKGVYNFYFPIRKPKIAYKFWDDLFSYYIKNETNLRNAINIFEKANNPTDNITNDIRVFYVPDSFVNLTYCVVDDKELYGGLGFITVFDKLKDGFEEMKVLSFGGESLDEYKTSTLNKIKELTIVKKGEVYTNNNLQEVSFKDVKNDILKSNNLEL